MEENNERRFRPLVIGSRASQQYSSSAANKAWTRRKKWKDLYYSFPTESAVDNFLKENEFNLVTTQDINPVSTEAQRILIPRCLGDMLGIITAAEKDKTVPLDMLTATRALGRPLAERASYILTLNDDEVASLRDDIVKFFNSNFINTLQITDNKYRITESLNKSIGDLSSSSQHEQSIATAKHIFQQFKYSPFPISDINDSHIVSMLLAVNELLKIYNARVENFRSNKGGTAPTTAIRWVRVYKEASGGKKQGYDVVVISTSGGDIPQRDLLAAINSIRPNKNHDIRVAPMVNENLPLLIPYALEVKKGGSFSRIKDAEYKADHDIQQHLLKDGPFIGVVLGSSTAPSCGSCVIAENFFKKANPGINFMQMPHKIIMTKKEMETWNFKGVVPGEGLLVMVDTLEYAKAVQEKKLVAQELSRQLNEVSGQRTDKNINFKFSTKFNKDNLQGKEIFRIQDSKDFVYVKVNETDNEITFAKVSSRKLNIKPDDNYVGGVQPQLTPEPIESAILASTILEDEIKVDIEQEQRSFPELLLESIHNRGLDKFLETQSSKLDNSEEELITQLINYEDWHWIIDTSPALSDDDIKMLNDNDLKGLNELAPFKTEKNFDFMDEIQGYVRNRRTINPVVRSEEILSQNAVGSQESKYLQLAKLFYFKYPKQEIPIGLTSATALLKHIASEIKKEEENFKKAVAAKLLVHLNLETTTKIVEALDDFTNCFQASLDAHGNLEKISKIIVDLKTYEEKFRAKGWKEDGLKNTISSALQQRLKGFNLPSFLLQTIDQNWATFSSKNPEQVNIVLKAHLQRKIKEYGKLPIERIKQVQKKLSSTNSYKTAAALEALDEAHRKYISHVKQEGQKLMASLGYKNEETYSLKIPGEIEKTSSAILKKMSGGFAIFRLQQAGANFVVTEASFVMQSFPQSSKNTEESFINQKFILNKSSDGISIKLDTRSIKIAIPKALTPMKPRHSP